MSRAEPIPMGAPQERVFVVGIDRGGLRWSVRESLEELSRLVQTANGDVVGSYVQRIARPVPKTYIGPGKARTIADEAAQANVDVVVFDDELSPSQQANLEDIMGDGIKVIDRTALILDIFARHATTREGRIQVQLAQNEYLLPRLRGMWSHLVREQTRGGIGSRFGQGESQLEVDRRLVRKRITVLKRELQKLESRRGEQSKSRSGGGLFRIALIGYTNAGKSTLLNSLTGAGAYVQDELFATLDPTTKSISLIDGRKATITDTVGFIQKLPTMLIESFKSTLSEARTADLLLLVADASDANVREQLATVQSVLKEIGATQAPFVLVFNKCDVAREEEVAQLRSEYENAEFISALTGKGLSSLAVRLAQEATQDEMTITVLIPYDRGTYVQLLHERSHVIREEYKEAGTLVTLRANMRIQQMLSQFRVDEQPSINATGSQDQET